MPKEVRLPAAQRCCYTPFFCNAYASIMTVDVHALAFTLRRSKVVAYYFPKLVELHNYAAANSVAQKTYNWNTLNEKVRAPQQTRWCDGTDVLLGIGPYTLEPVCYFDIKEVVHADFPSSGEIRCCTLF